MLIFVLVLLVVSVFLRQNQPKMLLFSCIILVIVEGIRRYSGTDYGHYAGIYESVSHTDFPLFIRPDFLYYFISGIFAKIQVAFPAFLVIFSGIYYFFFYRSLQRYGIFPQVALLVLFVTNIGLLGSNRQILAMSLGFFALILFLENKKWAFFALLLAVLSHISALVLLPLFLLNRNFSKKFTFLFIAFVLGLLVFPLDRFFMQFFQNPDYKDSYIYSHLQIYFTQLSLVQHSSLHLLLGILRRSLIILPFYLVNDFRRSKYFFFLRNTAVLSLALYLICVFHFTFLLGRLTIYYQMFDALSIALFANYFYKTRWKYHFLIGVGIFSVVIFFKSIAPYPQLFIPYHTIFGTF